MTTATLVNLLTSFRKEIRELRLSVLWTLKDPLVSLKDKLKVLEACPIFIIKPYIPSVSNIGKREISWYDDFGIERYQTVAYVDIFEMVDEHTIDCLDQTEEEMLEDWVITKEEADYFKEQILLEGYTHFVYDW